MVEVSGLAVTVAAGVPVWAVATCAKARALTPQASWIRLFLVIFCFSPSGVFSAHVGSV
jgi:hypothetical protein